MFYKFPETVWINWGFSLIENNIRIPYKFSETFSTFISFSCSTEIAIIDSHWNSPYFCSMIFV